jgi:phospholipid transport system substrate-binding protein
MIITHPYAFLTVALLAFVSMVPTRAQAGEPTEQLRSSIDRVYALHQTDHSSTAERESAGILDQMFDWPRMSETALQRTWRARTASERAELTQLFADLFRRAYLSRIHVVDASKFQYLGDAVTADRATVKTKVLTKKGSTIDVDYAVRLTGDDRRWRVQDVRVEQVSLVDNYRAQFDTFLARSSYEALVEKLRETAK